MEFMVLSAPRSASTWVANWLTTERTLCLHDPVLELEPESIDAVRCDRMLGISCTALALLPDFVNGHPARKVIVHRDFDDVNRSLKAIGLTALGAPWRGALDKIEGFHVDFFNLFNPLCAAEIYLRLTGLPIDLERYDQLCAMHVEPNFEKVKIVPERARSFRRRLSAALGAA